MILEPLRHGRAPEEVMALVIAYRLVDELDLVGIRVCRRSPVPGGQMLAVDASQSQAPCSDVARYTSLLASFVGILRGGKEEFQLLADETHGGAESVAFVVKIGHWHRKVGGEGIVATRAVIVVVVVVVVIVVVVIIANAMFHTMFWEGIISLRAMRFVIVGE